MFGIEHARDTIPFQRMLHRLRPLLMKHAPRIIALLFPVACGVLFALIAIISQDGYARGYSSVGFLFLIGPKFLVLAIAAVVVLSLGKGIQNALLL